MRTSECLTRPNQVSPSIHPIYISLDLSSRGLHTAGLAEVGMRFDTLARDTMHKMYEIECIEMPNSGLGLFVLFGDSFCQRHYCVTKP